MSKPRQPVLFVNPRSGGGGALRAAVPDLARGRGIDVITLGTGASLAELVESAVAADADVLGVAGGDGSLAVVAAAACEYGLPFVCVPSGTCNHFALDIGLDPDDAAGALDAFVAGVERRVDVGEVNGRLFLNNVSLGIYGDALQEPEYRDAKARTLLQTAEKVLGPSGRATHLQVADDRGRIHRRPAVVLVSNNPYALEPSFPRGARPSLDGGRLGVLVLDAPQSREPLGHAWTTARLDVTGSSPVHAGIDGEACDLDVPLHFAIRPGALRVLVPPARQVPSGRRGAAR